MSGPFGSSQWMYSSGAAFYPFAIDQSLRFNDNDSAYLSRTPASASNRKTWTWSGWVKPCNIGVEQNLLSVRSGTSYPHMLFYMQDSNSGGKVRIIEQNSSTTYINVEASPFLRDPSAWYHIVLAVDTTQATSSDRVKFYINGEQPSLSLTTYPSQNQDTMVNSTTAHAMGRRTTNGGAQIYSDKYLAEVNFIDGQALDPTSFGEFKSGVWVANEYTGSYGTNGFRLSFADSSNIGDDTSGNTNDWTANNLAATDVLLDSPTGNNFATWNPVAKNSSFGMTTLSEGNLRSYNGAASNQYSEVSFYLDTSNKYYFEYYNINTTGSFNPASLKINDPANLNGNKIEIYITTNGSINVDGSVIGTGFPTLAAGDILQVAYDGGTGKIWLGKNGTYYNASGTAIGNPSAGTDPIATLTPVDFRISSTFYQQGAIMNFGQDSSFAGNKTRQGNTDANGYGDFYYDPGDCLALCTANLPDPVIDPAQDDVPSDYFNTVLGTGTGSTQSISVGFQPDFLWIKRRDAAINHAVYDAIRGGVNALRTNTTGAESQFATDTVITYETDGFEIAGGATSGFNGSGDSFVAWNWLAGNGTSSNTDGSISSTISVNQKAGFSIVKWAGDATNATIGHGLGVAPSWVLVKRYDRSGDAWRSYHEPLGPTKFLEIFNTDAAQTSAVGAWNDTAPTSSVFTIGSGLNNGGDIIAYCFAEVEGYSKFGSFVGNDNADGPFVYLGFRPSLLILKNASAAQPWVMIDSTRSTYNVSANKLYPNASDAENSTSTDNSIDLLSNGFKPRGAASTNDATNGPSNTIIYMAFAENPFKYANAR